MLSNPIPGVEGLELTDGLDARRLAIVDRLRFSESDTFFCSGGGARVRAANFFSGVTDRAFVVASESKNFFNSAMTVNVSVTVAGPTTTTVLTFAIPYRLNVEISLHDRIGVL